MGSSVVLLVSLCLTDAPKLQLRRFKQMSSSGRVALQVRMKIEPLRGGRGLRATGMEECSRHQDVCLRIWPSDTSLLLPSPTFFPILHRQARMSRSSVPLAQIAADVRVTPTPGSHLFAVWRLEPSASADEPPPPPAPLDSDSLYHPVNAESDDACSKAIQKVCSINHTRGIVLYLILYTA